MKKDVKLKYITSNSTLLLIESKPAVDARFMTVLKLSGFCWRRRVRVDIVKKGIVQARLLNVENIS